MRSLDSLVASAAKSNIKLRTNAICIEKKPKEFAELKQSFEMAGLGARVVETIDFTDLKDGEIGDW